MIPRSSLTSPGNTRRGRGHQSGQQESDAAIADAGSSNSAAPHVDNSFSSLHRHQTDSMSSTISASVGFKPLDYSSSVDTMNPSGQHPFHHQVRFDYESAMASSSETPDTAADIAYSMPRSNPIAIQRPSSSGERNVKAEDSDTDDDDDSEIDVEGDALKLQRKYGGKIVQTYQDTSTMFSMNVRRTSNNNKNNRSGVSSMLNAPYLGSLSKSANEVLSLPPISLAGDEFLYDNSNDLVEPPEAIGSYGSLRDSHERGRFLDGPSSYREPTSGKIRQLDHRLRYHGKQPEISIGERMQQSRRLKEMREKEMAKKKQESGSGDDNNDGSKDSDKKNPPRSSLSAMMNEITKSASPAFDFTDEDASPLGQEMLVPIKTNDMPSLRDDGPLLEDNVNNQQMGMLSTSLTAFEILKSSNIGTSSSGNYNTVFGRSGLKMATTNTSTFTTGAGGTRQSSDQRFQPLARSMSDPTPHFQQLSIRGHKSSNAATRNAISSRVDPTQNEVQQQRYNMNTTNQQTAHVNSPSLLTSSGGVASMVHGPFPQNPSIPSSTRTFGMDSSHCFNYIPTVPDHDPNTDGAFGEMDME